MFTKEEITKFIVSLIPSVTLSLIRRAPISFLQLYHFPHFYHFLFIQLFHIYFFLLISCMNQHHPLYLQPWFPIFHFEIFLFTTTSLIDYQVHFKMMLLKKIFQSIISALISNLEIQVVLLNLKNITFITSFTNLFF